MLIQGYEHGTQRRGRLGGEGWDALDDMPVQSYGHGTRPKSGNQTRFDHC